MVVDQQSALAYDECSKFMPLRQNDTVYVVKVYDGDTVTLAWNDPITKAPVRAGCRIKGIDTPEMRGGSEREKDLALKARDRLEREVMGTFVTIVSPEHEKYGRVLCDLRTEECDSVARYMLRDPEVCRPYQGGKKTEW